MLHTVGIKHVILVLKGNRSERDCKNVFIVCQSDIPVPDEHSVHFCVTSAVVLARRMGHAEPVNPQGCAVMIVTEVDRIEGNGPVVASVEKPTVG